MARLNIIDHKLGPLGGDPPAPPPTPPDLQAALDAKVLQPGAAEDVKTQAGLLGRADLVDLIDQHLAQVATWAQVREEWAPPPPDHIYRACIWVDCPPELLGKKVSIFVASRDSAPSRGYYTNKVPGDPCGTCGGGVEPPSHNPSATDDEKAAIASGAVLEFVIDEAGGQVPDSFTDQQTDDFMRAFAAEVDAAVAMQASIAALPQKGFVGRAVNSADVVASPGGLAKAGG